MAKTIIPQGAEIDKLRSQIVASIDACKSKITQLTKDGCQAGNWHFRTDRPNAMCLWVPQEGGGRKIEYVGVDPEKQEQVKAAVERYRQRDSLRASLERLERDLRAVDHRIKSVIYELQAVRDEATEIVAAYQ